MFNDFDDLHMLPEESTPEPNEDKDEILDNEDDEDDEDIDDDDDDTDEDDKE